MVILQEPKAYILLFSLGEHSDALDFCWICTVIKYFKDMPFLIFNYFKLNLNFELFCLHGTGAQQNFMAPKKFQENVNPYG